MNEAAGLVGRRSVERSVFSYIRTVVRRVGTYKAEMSTVEEAVWGEEEAAKDTEKQVEEGEAAKMAENAEEGEGEVDTPKPEQAVEVAE